MSSHIPYAKIPIIHQDLRREEMVVQITQAFDYLENVSNNIFHHIKTSVEKQKSHVQKLQERSRIIQAKMDKLALTNKATKVFASAKYPGGEIPVDHQCDILSSPLPPINRCSVPITSKHRPFDPDSLKTMHQHFHVKRSNKQIRKNIEVTPEEGLGSLPYDLDSVSSLLLFNTSENLYKKYVMLDPLGIVTKTRKVLEEEVKGDLGAAPQSMCEEGVDFKGAENYFYTPTLQDVPELDVPLDLPDLPGIADDLQFSMDSGPPIGPSGSGSFTIIPELPSVIFDSLVETVLPTPPLPPPPPPEMVMKSVAPVVHAPPAPPPPPPPEMVQPTPPVPPQQPPMQTSTTAPAPPQALVSLTKNDDARANLMEAIRNAGGNAKLRSVADRKQEAKRLKEEEEVIHKGSGGNLMADLHAKLSLRRKGISGSQPMFGDPMEKVLSMIPPPPIKGSDTDEQDEGDADWED